MEESTPVRRLTDWLRGDRRQILQDATVFSQVYEKTHVNVFRYLSALSGCGREEAEDLTAEVYLRAWKSRARFSGDEEAALGWFLRIARNLAFDSARRARHLKEYADISDDLPDPQSGPENDLIRRERKDILVSLLSCSSDEDRELLVLRYVLEWQVKAIATQMGIPENTASVKIHRALNRLQRAWPEDDRRIV